MNDYPKFPDVKVNFLLDIGGLGDNIARMPAIRYIKDRHPHVTPIVWVADYFLPVAKNMMLDIDFRAFSTGAKDYDETLPTRTTGLKSFTNLKTRMDIHAFCLLANEIPSDSKHYNYLPINLNPIAINKFNLPKKYVTITTGFTAEIREFYAPYVNTLAKYIISKGYKVMFLGQKNTHTGVNKNNIIGSFSEAIDYSVGIDLIDKTSLLEAAKIMAKSKVVLGVDNGLLNLAACTDVPIIAGFTSVDPEHRMPYRNDIKGWNFFPVVPTDSEPDKFCQSRWDFCFEHDFRFSLYNNDSLIKSLKPDLWIEKLKEIL